MADLSDGATLSLRGPLGGTGGDANLQDQEQYQQQAGDRSDRDEFSLKRLIRSDEEEIETPDGDFIIKKKEDGLTVAERAREEFEALSKDPMLNNGHARYARNLASIIEYYATNFSHAPDARDEDIPDVLDWPAKGQHWPAQKFEIRVKKRKRPVRFDGLLSASKKQRHA